MIDALYNENDPFAAQWLRNLIAAGHIAPGRVDERSIADLTPDDVAGPGQRHFFAGIGGWSYACRLAGVPDDADIWTGSCPCQPLSDAGKRLGARDPRHLWPAWFELIRECRPPVIYGEQVASRLGLGWLDLVRADLEGCGYAVGASDLCAAGVGAPHIRQRLYFVAVAGDERREGLGLHVRERGPRTRLHETGGAARLVGDASSARSGRHAGAVSDAQAQGEAEWRGAWRVADEPVDAGGELGDATASRLQGPARSDGEVLGLVLGDAAGGCSKGVADTAAVGRRARDGELRTRQHESDAARSGAVDWSIVEWLPCTDGVSRPVEPGLEPLVNGLFGRVVVRGTDETTGEEIEHVYSRCGALAGFGNAIVPQVGAVFIRCAEEARRALK